MRSYEVVLFFKKIGLCSECGPQTSSISITWERQISSPALRSTESETLIVVLWEGGTLQGLKRGLLSNTWKRTVQGDTADQARDFSGKGHPGGEQ